MYHERQRRRRPQKTFLFSPHLSVARMSGRASERASCTYVGHDFFLGFCATVSLVPSSVRLSSMNRYFGSRPAVSLARVVCSCCSLVVVVVVFLLLRCLVVRTSRPRTEILAGGAARRGAAQLGSELTELRN